MSDPVARLNAALEGRYAIERELGEGGMAVVYLAEDLKHRRPVALKVMKPELARILEQAYDEGGFERVGALRAEMLVAQSNVGFVRPTNIAHNFADAGEAEKALEWLERGLQLHGTDMPYCAVEKWPEEVQIHPRFREIRRQMGLPEWN